MKSLLFLALAGLLLAGCTTTDEIIIDQQGVDMSHYQQDLLECRQLAQQVRTGEKAARGAGSGALLGGAVGAILDGAEGAARGAGTGAVTGGARGLVEGKRSENSVVKRCLQGRGYRVLN